VQMINDADATSYYGVVSDVSRIGARCGTHEVEPLGYSHHAVGDGHGFSA
jgi:hypothetical protein